ncbi:MAG: hypothetical protein IT196_11060 [Acidimicrobiales bacterium]|nr:hypothetical protein [Acidimicrobiales bacterium]
MPTDIPWRKIAVSEDMIARPGAAAPPQWRSSLVVFGYEPPEEEQLDDATTVSYVKVVASITGFQPDPTQTGFGDRRAYRSFQDPLLFEEYERAATAYYGCYGALLDVAITPGGPLAQAQQVALADYPYIADFEPKKRELYELVSETGEAMSRSLESVNVRKGSTTSQSHEVLDQLAVSAGVTGGTAAVQGNAGVTHTSGTKDLSGESYENVRTTDAGREFRETFSHTTQLSQLYHQLSSYHLGTNRAVFFVLPRPHIVQTASTFVDGPRVLEGVQEFFLVVVRPRGQVAPCVEATLETAHLADTPGELAYERSTGTLALHVEQPAPAHPNTLSDDSVFADRSDSATYTPPEGWEIDLDRVGEVAATAPAGVSSELEALEQLIDSLEELGFAVPPELQAAAAAAPAVAVRRATTAARRRAVRASQSAGIAGGSPVGGRFDVGPGLLDGIGVPAPRPDLGAVPAFPPAGGTRGYRIDALSGRNVVAHGVTADLDHVVASATVRGEYIDESMSLDDRSITGVLDLAATVFIRRRQPVVVSREQTLYLTSRTVTSCSARAAANPATANTSVTYEQPLSGLPVVQRGASMSIIDANRVRARIGEELPRSVNHPARYPRGVVRFSDTEFVARSIVRLLPATAHPDNGSGAAVLKGLPPALSKKVLQAAPGISRRRLLVVPLGELADRLAISIEEAAALRRAALGLETPPSSKAATWDRPTKVGSKQVATRPPRRSADPTPPPPKTAGSRATGARAPRQPRS